MKKQGTEIQERPFLEKKRKRSYRTLRFKLSRDADGLLWSCPSPFAKGETLILRYGMIEGFLRENTKSMPGKRLTLVFQAPEGDDGANPGKNPESEEKSS